MTGIEEAFARGSPHGGTEPRGELPRRSAPATMIPRRARLAAASALLACLLLVVATIAAMRLNPDQTLPLDYLFFSVPLSWTAVGAVIAVQRPGNRIGWLCLAIGLGPAASGRRC